MKIAHIQGVNATAEETPLLSHVLTSIRVVTMDTGETVEHPGAIVIDLYTAKAVVVLTKSTAEAHDLVVEAAQHINAEDDGRRH